MIFFKIDFSLIEEKINYVFKEKKLLVLAFTHRSFVNEMKGATVENNERLEFLGDAILGLIVSEFLYQRLPSSSEGLLSQLRARLVDAASCARYLQKLLLADSILLGRGEKMSEGNAKISIQADVFEALIAALYLDGGLNAVKSFFISHFDTEIEQIIGSPPRNFKAELQDYSQKRFQCTPIYQVVQEAGPDHAKIFHVLVTVNEKKMGMGVGMSKKESEQNAASEALIKLT